MTRFDHFEKGSLIWMNIMQFIAVVLTLWWYGKYVGVSKGNICVGCSGARCRCWYDCVAILGWPHAEYILFNPRLDLISAGRPQYTTGATDIQRSEPHRNSSIISHVRCPRSVSCRRPPPAGVAAWNSDAWQRLVTANLHLTTSTDS